MGLMKKLTSALVASSLVLSLVGSAFAAYTPGAGEAAGTRMQALGIVKGRPEGGLALNSEITRAELVTTIVRAFGQEENAKYLMGSTIFPDIANHWASGNIAMAVALVEKAGGDAIGMPDGTFAPDVKLTPAQAVAFLMKFIGLKADATKAWPANYLDVAVEKGLITAEDKALIAAETGNATRGLTFYLFDNAFYNYKLADGKTFYTKYVVTNGPTLTMNDLADTTMDSKVTVTGNAKGAVEVYVGSTKVTPDASGNFSAEFALPEVKAEPYTVTVTAIDLAGNRVEKSDTIARVVGNIAAIEASAITVAAGATVDVAAAVKDEAGNVIADAAVTGESTVGTFADGKFTAGEKAEAGKLTLKAGEVTTTVDVTVTAGPLAKVVTSAPSVAPGKFVTVMAQDAYGNTVTGATFTQDVAGVSLDATTGAFIAEKAGTYTVKATKDGVTVEGTVGVYGSVAKLVVSAPETAIANGASKFNVTVTAVDSKGNVVSSFKDEITYADDTLTATDPTVSAVNGVATFEFKAAADLADIELDIPFTYVTDADAEPVEISDEFIGTVTLVEQVATSIKVAALGDYLATNDTATPTDVKVTILDQAGKEMKTGAYEVSLTITGPGSFTGGDDDTTTDLLVEGNETISVYAQDEGDAGDVTITATFTGLTSGSDTMKAALAQTEKAIKVVASDDEAITVDGIDSAADDWDYASYTLTLVDRVGVPNPYASADVTVKFADVDDEDILVSLDEENWVSIENGKFSFPVADGTQDFYVMNTNDGTVSFTVSDDAKNLTSSSTISTTWVAEEATVIGFASQTMNVLRDASAKTTFTAQLKDRYGNKVADAGVGVKFTSSIKSGVSVNGESEVSKVVTDANGVATVVVTVAPYVANSFTLTVADNDDNYTLGANNGLKSYGTVTLNVKNQVAASMAATVVDADDADLPRLSSFTAGDTVKAVGLKVEVKDNYGFGLEGLTVGDFKVVTSGADDDIEIDLAAEDLGEGYYLLTGITPVNAGTVTFTISIRTVGNEVTATRNLLVKAGEAVGVKLAEGSSVTVKKNTETTFTVQLVDAYGNLVSSLLNDVNRDVVLSTTATGASNGSYANFRNTSNVPLTNDTLKIAAGKNSAQFKFMTDATGEYTITLNLGGEVTVVDVNSPDALYTVGVEEEGVVEITTDTWTAVDISILDKDGVVSTAAHGNIVVDVDAAAGLKLAANNDGTGLVGATLTFAAGEFTKTIYVQATALDTVYELTLTPDGTASEADVVVEFEAPAPVAP